MCFINYFQIKNTHEAKIKSKQEAQRALEELILQSQKEATEIVAKQMAKFTTVSGVVLLVSSIIGTVYSSIIYIKSDNPNKTHYPHSRKVNNNTNIHNLSRTIITPSVPTVTSTNITTASPTTYNFNQKPLRRETDSIGISISEDIGFNPPNVKNPNSPKPQKFSPSRQSSIKPFGRFKKI